MWQYRGDSGPHIVASNYGRMSNRDASYVGDGIHRASRQNANRYSNLTRSRTRSLRMKDRWNRDRQHQCGKFQSVNARYASRLNCSAAVTPVEGST